MTVARLLPIPCFVLAAFVVTNSPSHSATMGHRSMDEPAFTRVILDLPANFTLRQSGIHRVQMSGESSILDKIGIAVSGGTLKIYPTASFSTQQPLELTVDFSSLQSLEVRSSTEVSVESLKGPSLALTASGSSETTLNHVNLVTLTVDSSGSATVNVAGESAMQRVSLNGSGEFQAADFKTESTLITVDDSAEASVWATKRLDATVSGSATVKYRGKPTIKQEISAAGTVESL